MPDKPLKLNFGSGTRERPEGYTNIDIVPHENVDIVADMREFEADDNSVDEIYCSHAFEYLNRVDAVAVLQRWFRFLRPGGVVRISVPDFKVLAELYVNEREPVQNISGPILGIKDGQHHKVIYDEALLSTMLITLGFVDVRKCSEMMTYSFPDDYSKAIKKGKYISLNIEAKKP